MNESHASGPPSSVHPDDVVTLGSGARVRDLATGESHTTDDWIAACAERESRPPDECRETLMNAIARGDLRVEDAGTGA
jgi:hypothetical protein